MWKLKDIRESVAWQEAFNEGMNEGIERAKRKFDEKFPGRGRISPENR